MLQTHPLSFPSQFLNLTLSFSLSEFSRPSSLQTWRWCEMLAVMCHGGMGSSYSRWRVRCWRALVEHSYSPGGVHSTSPFLMWQWLAAHYSGRDRVSFFFPLFWLCKLTTQRVTSSFRNWPSQISSYQFLCKSNLLCSLDRFTSPTAQSGPSFITLPVFKYIISCIRICTWVRIS